MQQTNVFMLVVVIGIVWQVTDCFPMQRDIGVDENNSTLFETDIILTPEQKKMIEEGVKAEKNGSPTILKRKFRKLANRWPGGIIYYEIDENIAVRTKRIRAAMTHMEVNTCIEFKPKSSSTANYLHFQRHFNDNGTCLSWLGMTGGEQGLYLGLWCDMGSIVHEILHAMGMIHEQSRPDRDQYVTIMWDNIKTGITAPFDKYPHEQIDMTVPYDIGSIMHYKDWLFSKNGKPTIVAKDPSKQSVMGQTEGLSAGDIETVKKAYGCTGTKGETGEGNTVKNCKTTTLGTEYAGDISVTNEGKKCLSWDQLGAYSASSFPEDTVAAAKNFCRNPDSDGQEPWCFYSTTYSYGYCKVPFCAKSQGTGDVSQRSSSVYNTRRTESEELPGSKLEQ